uniref:Uncharacterized protein n=1 Tax=Oryza meridionalis TaxID=40149 RepID=A0A0E0EJ46_9ORYZ
MWRMAFSSTIAQPHPGDMPNSAPVKDSLWPTVLHHWCPGRLVFASVADRAQSPVPPGDHSPSSP